MDFSKLIAMLVGLLGCLATRASESPSGDAGQKHERPQISPFDMYKRLFKQKRATQKDALKNLLTSDDIEKQNKMITLVLEKLFIVMTDAKVKLMEAGFTPGDAFPTDEGVRDAFSNVAENTALFGDILVHLPDITHRILRAHREWDVIIRWSIGFCNETQVYEGNDVTLLNIMAQELRIVERNPNYVNPYSEETQKLRAKQQEELLMEKERKKKEEKKKKREKRRGPRLSGVKHTEL